MISLDHTNSTCFYDSRATYRTSLLPEDVSETRVIKQCRACTKSYTASLLACPDCGSQLFSAPDAGLIGKRLADRYVIESKLGSGGMGVVYKGWHDLMKRPVAIKVLRTQLLQDESNVKRFQQEAIAASRLKHPNIITVYDFGETGDGSLFLVMDVLEGYSLADLFKQKGCIGVERSIKIFSQVCDALEHAHKQGVVHRDLKPGNIMICPTETDPDLVKVVDFGIAKVMSAEADLSLTQKGEVFGSPLYMSPEQCLARPLDGRSDIYSLGNVLYEALAGNPPFLGGNMIATIDMQIHKQPANFADVRPDLYIPERLEAVVHKALAKDPEQRFQTMEEFGLALRSALPGARKPEPPRPVEPSQELTRKIKALTIALTLSIVALLSTIFGYALLKGKERKQADSTANPNPGQVQGHFSNHVTANPLPKAELPRNSSVEPGKQSAATTAVLPNAPKSHPNSTVTETTARQSKHIEVGSSSRSLPVSEKNLRPTAPNHQPGQRSKPASGHQTATRSSSSQRKALIRKPQATKAAKPDAWAALKKRAAPPSKVADPWERLKSKAQ